MVINIHNPEEREELFPELVDGTKDFYYYPENKAIAVSKEGYVLNLVTNRLLVVSYVENVRSRNKRAIINIPGYKNIPYNTSGTTSLHRVIARTFVGRPLIYKDIPYKDLQVNHIDCDSTNNSPDNLEWCTNIENVQHFFDSGESTQSVPTVIKNVRTGQIKKFPSISGVVRFFHIPMGSLSELLKLYSGGLAYQGWLIKYDDGSAWSNVKYDLAFPNRKPVVLKNIKTEEIVYFDTLVKTSDFLGINYFTLALHIRSESYLKYRYNDWVISLNEGMSWPNIDINDESKNFLSNSLFVVKDLVNDREYSFGSRVDCYNFLGILEGRFRSYVDQGNYKKFRLGNFIIRKFGDDDYPDLNIDSPDYPHNRSTIVEIKNIHSNEVIRFESAGEASRYLDVKRATLNNALLKGFNYRYRIGDWIVRREDQEWPELNMAHSSLRPAVESRDYKIVDISNGNITIVSGITEVSRLVGASRGRVDRGLKKDNVVQINGYEISYYE